MQGICREKWDAFPLRSAKMLGQRRVHQIAIVTKYVSVKNCECAHGSSPSELQRQKGLEVPLGFDN